MKSISLNTLREMLYDIHNGLFSADYEPSYKYYHDEENDLGAEVHSEYKHLTGAWVLEVTITDSWGDEYMLEDGQWEKLYKALMSDVEWREQEARSEAEHIKQLWRAAYV